MQSAALARPDRQFLPPPPARAPANNPVLRAAVCHVLSELRRQPLEEVAAEAGWKDDRTLGAILTRTATTPASTTGWGAAFFASSNIAAEFVAGLGPGSAARRLIAAGISVDLAGVQTCSLPWPSSTPPLVFVGEGQPIPVSQGVLSGGTIGPVRKAALIMAVSGQLADYSSPNVVQVVTVMLQESAARSLDGALFSAVAGDSLRPPGLLFGVTPLTPTAGGGLTAAAGDVGKICSAIAQAGGGASIMLFADPAAAARLPMLCSGGLQLPVVPVVTLAPGTLIGVETAGFGSAFSGLPVISTSAETVLHMVDTAPQHIGAAGSPTVPAQSMFQTDSLALRCVLNLAFGMRSSGLVQLITGVSW